MCPKLLNSPKSRQRLPPCSTPIQSDPAVVAECATAAMDIVSSVTMDLLYMVCGCEPTALLAASLALILPRVQTTVLPAVPLFMGTWRVNSGGL